MDLKGIYPPITTPFKDEEVDFAGLESNVSRYMATGVAGVVVLGSNGEAPHLSESEARAVVEAVRARVPKGRWLIAGAGHYSTRETIAAARDAAKAGADLVLVKTPGYFKAMMTQEAFIRHFTAVADASPVPVILYDCPMFTGVSLQAATVARLAEHPNIAGIKESAPDIALVADFVTLTPASFQVVVGSAPTLFASLAVGAVGGIVALACVLPDLCVRLHTLVGQQRWVEALDLQRRLTPLARSITSAYGVGGLKAALDMAGYVGGLPRMPLVRPGPEGIETIKNQIAALAEV
ncbi:MAG: dihydrodipicolinate synthase family protein [Vicinamibacterales bacterium]